MAKKKVIIAGSRDFTDKRFLFNMAGFWYGTLQSVPEIFVVSGCAIGADTIGEEWASYMGFPVLKYPVTAKDWADQGKKAGILRNVAMAEMGDVLLAFWDGKSPGTKHMIGEALRRGLEVHVWQGWSKPSNRGRKRG